MTLRLEQIEAHRQALLMWLETQETLPVLKSLETLSQTTALPKPIRAFAGQCRVHFESESAQADQVMWALLLGRLDRWIVQATQDPLQAEVIEPEINHALGQLERWIKQRHRFWENSILLQPNPSP